MSSLPLPIRVAAGLAAIALERARTLPRDVTEWPMSAVSQALQVTMRVQQRITELAIKGDEALAALREPEEDPPWAVFDEDLPDPRPEEAGFDLEAADTTTPEEQSWLEALDEVYGAAPAEPPEGAATTGTPNTDARTDGHAGEGGAEGPAAVPNYPGLSLASVRGRLRVLTVDDLEELLEYERGHAARPEFLRLLSNRIATVRGQ